MKDFGYVRGRDESTSQIIKKSLFVVFALLSVFGFFYITINAYHYIYHDQNSEIEVIKSPPFSIKVFNNTDVNKNDEGRIRVYDDILGKKMEKEVVRVVESPKMVTPQVAEMQKLQIRPNVAAPALPATPIKNKQREVRVQLLALNSKNGVKEFWEAVNKKHSGLFSNLKPRVEEIDLGKRGIFYRLQVGNFFDQIEAENFCKNYIAQTNKNSADCIIVE